MSAAYIAYVITGNTSTHRPFGRLWLTGHDLGEANVMEAPPAGSELRWIATVMLPGVEGQGVA